jgi:hypothetical protein
MISIEEVNSERRSNLKCDSMFLEKFSSEKLTRDLITQIIFSYIIINRICITKN